MLCKTDKMILSALLIIFVHDFAEIVVYILFNFYNF